MAAELPALPRDAWETVLDHCEANDRQNLLNALPELETRPRRKARLDAFGYLRMRARKGAVVSLERVTPSLRLTGVMVDGPARLNCGKASEARQVAGHLSLETLDVVRGDPTRLGLLFPRLRVARHHGPLPLLPLTHLQELKLTACADLGSLRLAGLRRLRALTVAAAKAVVELSDLPVIEKLCLCGIGVCLARLEGCPALASVQVREGCKVAKAELARPLETLTVRDAVLPGLPARSLTLSIEYLPSLPTLPDLERLALWSGRTGVLGPQPSLRCLELPPGLVVAGMSLLPALEECRTYGVLPDAPRLRRLQLNNCAVPDLARFPLLRDLTLSSTPDLRILPPLPCGLERLHLSSCDDLQTLPALPTTTDLSLEDCPAYDPEADGLAAKCPAARNVVLDSGLRGPPLHIAWPSLHNLALLGLARSVEIPSLPDLRTLEIKTSQERPSLTISVAAQPSLESLSADDWDFRFGAPRARAFVSKTSCTRRKHIDVPGACPGFRRTMPEICD